MSSLPMVDEDDESALYIDESSQITEDMQIGEDDDVLEEDMDFDEEDEIAGFTQIQNESCVRDKVFVMKVPESKLPAGTSIKKISSASDITNSNPTANQPMQLLKLPNPNLVSIKEVPKENLGIKMVSPKGINFTLIAKKSPNPPVTRGEFIPILPKLIPAPLTGNFMTTTTITSSGIGPMRSEPPPPKVIKVNTGDPIFKTFIGATVITQKPMPQLQPQPPAIIQQKPLLTSGPAMMRPVTIKQIPNTQAQVMSITTTTPQPVVSTPQPQPQIIVSKETPFPVTSVINMSPRSQQRSKSLTMAGAPNSVETRRKLSASSIESSIPLPQPPEAGKSQVDSIIEEDDDVQIIEKVSETEIIEESDEEGEVIAQYVEQPIIELPPKKVPLSKVHQDSPAKLLKWENQIGNLNKCRFKFELNEFGLLEIMEKGILRNRLDIGYEKPLFERQASASTKENEPLYYCVGCHCKGAAVDFLGPVFCSVECLKRASKRRSSSLKSKIIKSNRRDPASNSLKRLVNNPPKPEIPMAKQRNESRIFNWRSYINMTKSEAAPIDLFLNPFPCGPNRFEVGMKLEAIDPENNSKFCICTVVQVLGYRIKLHFDKFSRIHDFWVNADSMDIFPPGWCTKTNRMLNLPKGIPQSTKFSWQQYLEKSQGIAAPRSLFTHLNSNFTSNQFKIGMKLEADDVKNTNKICVATVADVIDNRILVHFDGWDECYDYWIEIDSPYIHPINYHQGCEEKDIIGPPGWDSPFRWTDYLLLSNSQAAQDSFFKPRKPLAFKKGMKLEVVDRKNPTIIRPATIVNVNNYSIKVLFDGWSPSYSYWVRDDSPDIHPIGWAENTGHSLEPPPTYSQLPQLLPCSTLGCRGIGNTTKSDAESHANAENCPYVLKNWNAQPVRINRFDELGGSHEERRPPPSNKRKQKQEEVVDIMDIQIKQEYDSDAENEKAKGEIPKIENSHPLENGVKESDDPKIDIDESIAVAKQLLYNYGPRLRQNYEVFCKNLNYMMPTGHVPHSNPLLWNIDETYDFLSKISSLSKTAELLKSEEIDGEGLLSMRKDDFTEIFKLPLGTAVKIYSIIVRLRCHVFKNFRNSLH